MVIVTGRRLCQCLIELLLLHTETGIEREGEGFKKNLPSFDSILAIHPSRHEWAKNYKIVIPRAISNPWIEYDTQSRGNTICYNNKATGTPMFTYISLCRSLFHLNLNFVWNCVYSIAQLIKTVSAIDNHSNSLSLSRSIGWHDNSLLSINVFLNNSTNGFVFLIHCFSVP